MENKVVTVITKIHPFPVEVLYVFDKSLSRAEIYDWAQNYLENQLNNPHMGGQYKMFIKRDSSCMVTTITYAEEHSLPIIFIAQICSVNNGI